jgi:hypothetical protein
MIIERSGFLLMAGTLAAGGVGGWLARDAKAQRSVEAPVAVLTPSLTAEPKIVVIEHAPPPPVCDDSTGTPEDCPAMGPADEGVCSNIAATRCADFKASFKPKVAQAAVSCLRSLKGNALCDPARVNLCGHSALMAACSEPPPAPASGDAGAVIGMVASPVVTACERIVASCGQPLGPTPADCRQTLSGMTDAGRANLVECMAVHCGDKGLLGCEATKKL